jgi:hypothetical protein
MAPNCAAATILILSATVAGAVGGGTLAKRAEDFLYTDAAVIKSCHWPLQSVLDALHYTGLHVVRVENWDILNSDACGNPYMKSLATDGIKLDVAGSRWSSCLPIDYWYEQYRLAFDDMVTTYPGSIAIFEGLNEPNNFTSCFQIDIPTTGSTVDGTNLILYFASVPHWLHTVDETGGGVINQFNVSDVTTPAAITAGNYLASIRDTTVTVAGGGGGSLAPSPGDAIRFQAPFYNPGAAIAHQQYLYDLLKGDPVLASIPVANFEDYPEWGYAPGMADLNNFHEYPQRASPPAGSAADTVAHVPPIQIPGLNSVVTEFGYRDIYDGAHGVNANVQGIYEIQGWLDNYRMGLPLTVYYEIFSSDYYQMYYDWTTPKPVSIARHNISAVLHDTAGSARSFSPGALNYSISGLPGEIIGNGPWGPGSYVERGGFSFLLQKADGNFYIVAYTSPWLFNAATYTELTPPTYETTVNLGITATTVKVYDPFVGTTAIATYSNTDSIPLTFFKHPFIVEVIP